MKPKGSPCVAEAVESSKQSLSQPSPSRDRESEPISSHLSPKSNDSTTSTGNKDGINDLLEHASKKDDEAGPSHEHTHKSKVKRRRVM